MADIVLWLVTLTFTKVFCENLDQSMAIRRERCHKGDKIINDCNWCRCKHNSFHCDARDCKRVDMFGHFNDAIQELNIGMEGHGYWRSRESACEPFVHYRRGSVLCVCSEDGNWPNPVCRDIFQVLHAVEVANESNTCESMKLYLKECNVCFCPSTGQQDPELCTKNECDEEDPVIKERAVETEEAIDVYAECTVDNKYKLDCQMCTCLRNNRLLCGNCTNTKEERNYCQSNPPHKVFNIDCNLCFCDSERNMICSTKRCLGVVKESARRHLMDIDERYFEVADRPIALHTCKIGTKYYKGCNTCVCMKHQNGKTMFACSVRQCNDNETLTMTVKKGCVLHKTYELNCLRCSCVMANDEKWQWCETDSKCSDVKSESTELSSMHGYCEPLHFYVNDCNNCQCLTNGQLVMCSDNKCDTASISVEIVPVLQHGHHCPKGTAYKVDCNICYCLLNGNSLCTTLDCHKGE